MTARPQEEEEPDEAEEVQTQGLLKSRKAVLPSEVRRRERSTEDPRRGYLEEQLWSWSQSGETEERHRPKPKSSVSHLVSKGRETIQNDLSKTSESRETHGSILKHQTLDIDRDVDDLSNMDSVQDPRVSVAQLRHSYMESIPPSLRWAPL